jgi:thioredoxin:protein disulfide reductase
MRPIRLLLVTVLALVLVGSTAHATTEDGDAFTRALSGGPMTAALAAFVGGLLVSLTPCVYPMIAVTVGVFGARKAESRWKGLVLSASFVFGMMVMFVGLGLFAALTGSVFGGALQSTWVVLAISSLFVLMALSMFGAFELTLPSGLLNRLAAVGGLGIRGAFLLGLVSGIVASPCTGPVLTGILAWIATTRDLLLGTFAMSAFALGLGVPFFVVGTFAVQLPKGGRWMVAVKTGLGVVLLVVALYFAAGKLPVLSSLIPRGAVGWMSALLAIIAGSIIAWVLARSWSNQAAARVAYVLSIACFTLSGFAVTTLLTRADQTLSWQHQSYRASRVRAQTEKLPLLIDFTASWCTACKELDRLTFADPQVRAEAGRFLAVKVDATVDDDPEVVAAMRELSVKGLPTVVLLDSSGREAKRFTDFVGASEFLRALRLVR